MLIEMKTQCFPIFILLVTIIKSASAESGDGVCVGGPGMCPTSLTPVINAVIDIIVVAAVLGCGFIIFRRLKE